MLNHIIMGRLPVRDHTDWVRNKGTAAETAADSVYSGVSKCPGPDREEVQDETLS